MKVTAPFEIGVCVRDLDRAMAFYRDVLGMSVFSIDEVTPDESSRAGLAPNGYRIARMETQTGDRLKLVAPCTVPLRQAEKPHVLARHGIAYLTYIVPDLAEIERKLKAAGAKLRTATSVQFRPAVRLLFAEDPDGNFLEFVQREDLATYRPKA